MSDSDYDNTEVLSKKALKYSSFYSGKIETSPKVPVTSLDDFSIWYSPGVAAVSKEISQNKDSVFEYTGKWNTIAVVTDGSRVLGLGDIGPEASLPVMEGKSLIFKYLGGVDAFPLPIAVKDSEEIIETIKKIQPGFGGINLEDISSPKCFGILERLQKELDIPVWHDDQTGTAGVTLAALLNSIDLVKKEKRGLKLVFYGAGAANIATANLLITAGFDPQYMIMLDSKGIMHNNREDIDYLKVNHPWKYDLCKITNKDQISGDLNIALKDADVLVAAAVQGPNAISPDQISTMASDAIVFALSNPVPEILPRYAIKAGAKIVATGRSDFPNQVNNSLLFPAVFRGVLDVRAKTITNDMVIVAAEELANFSKDNGLSTDHIIPNMAEWKVYPKIAAKVGEKAVQSGLARKILTKDEIYKASSSMIIHSRDSLSNLMKNNVISPFPK